jgi:hypothetical protein
LDASVLSGRDLEPFIADNLSKSAKGSSFEGTIKIIGGQKFPDIVANKYYGVEVKSTKQDHWVTTGNSVLESTRVEDVERIYMMFGKLADPIQFKCRPYEDCLSEVVVTHSPRYLIDMDLKVGNTIFDKIGLPYDKLRIFDPPLKPILEYYHNQVRPGQQVWWLSGSSSIIIKLWNSLSILEREDVKVKGFVFFPSVFSNRSDKFNEFVLWLVQTQSVVCPNVRDIYTAGGQVSFTLNGNRYKNVPRIIGNALVRLGEIKELIDTIDIGTLSKYWQTKVSRKSAFAKWISVVDREVKKGNQDLNTTQLFEDYIAYNNL